jgi:hypothetical protein
MNRVKVKFPLTETYQHVGAAVAPVQRPDSGIRWLPKSTRVLVWRLNPATLIIPVLGGLWNGRMRRRKSCERGENVDSHHENRVGHMLRMADEDSRASRRAYKSSIQLEQQDYHRRPPKDHAINRGD